MNKEDILIEVICIQTDALDLMSKALSLSSGPIESQKSIDEADLLIKKAVKLLKTI